MRTPGRRHRTQQRAARHPPRSHRRRRPGGMRPAMSTSPVLCATPHGLQAQSVGNAAKSSAIAMAAGLQRNTARGDVETHAIMHCPSLTARLLPATLEVIALQQAQAPHLPHSLQDGKGQQNRSGCRFIEACIDTGAFEGRPLTRSAPRHVVNVMDCHAAVTQALVCTSKDSVEWVTTWHC